jgi:Circadian oscillating protein COP23
MPIDPKKFKKVVTNHFDNLTEEEFLKTLQKSSPHLFDENSVIHRDIPIPEKSNLQSKNVKKACKEYNVIFYENQVIKHEANTKLILFGIKKQYSFALLSIVAVSSILSIFALNTFEIPSAAQAFTSENKFYCSKSVNDVLLVVKTGDEFIPFIKFTSTEFGTGYSRMDRCNAIKQRLNRYTNQSKSYITTGIRDERSILCVSKKIAEGCIKDEYGGEILSLGSSDTNAELYLKTLLEILRSDNFRDRSSILVQTQDRVYIGKQSLSSNIIFTKNLRQTRPPQK